MKSHVTNLQRTMTAGVFLLLFTLGLPTTSAARGKKGPDAAPAPEVSLVWPLPPAQPRIRWVQQISEFEDVTKRKKKRKSWFARVAGAAEENDAQITNLKAPCGIATDSRGRIYVADYQLRSTALFDLAQRQVELRRPTARAPLLFPIGLALDKHDRLFVSDPVDRSITCFSPEGEPRARFGREELVRPTGLAIDRERNRLYVADVKEHRISVFDTEKSDLVRHIGKPGKGPGEFLAPTNVAVNREGNLHVTDNLNYRIQILNRRGRFLRTFGEIGNGPGYFARPKGVGADSKGPIYVLDAEYNNLQTFNQDGETLLYIGSLGADPREFQLPAGLYIGENDRIYTTEQYSGRVQILQYIPQPDAVEAKLAAMAKNGKEVRAAKK